MASEAILEELEVLESIYPTELQRISDTDIQIEAEQDEELDGTPNIKLLLSVHYPESYPDALPDLKLSVVNGEISEKDLESLTKDLVSVGEENVGMAMTFTLVAHLREQLTKLARSNENEKVRLEQEKERKILEDEEARTRGTPVTAESFNAWKAKFDEEMSRLRAKEEEEKLKGLTPKEREEYKRSQTRLSGRQLFERNRNLDEGDESLIEEGTVSVDVSQYDRIHEDEEQEEGLTFSDSD
ncbi:RWD-domain-containing protein [Coprinopsis marcescibilis]|uniref:RWD-domain-containing protein n=1 Tax=Coprinopsis marcescibilis TaxID=230819 RepID=A0A5C3LAX0_COPMA|nr:RWD-domain-containing protein [Coprinopsis marcescibilis]